MRLDKHAEALGGAAMADRVVHFEIPYDDAERAKNFYSEAFGWAVTDLPGMGYTTAATTATDDAGQPRAPGAINGGMAQRQSPINAPVITIEVEDVNAALDTVERLGGHVVQTRQTVPDMGYTGYFADTEGNVVGLWQSTR